MTHVAKVVVLKHALVDVRDLPDLPLVEQRDRVYVLNYLWGTECVVEDAVLQSRTGERTSHGSARPLNCRGMRQC